jgi:two-component system, sensor histidine kinase and response regulator
MKIIKIILIEDNPADAQIFQEYLSNIQAVRYNIEVFGDLTESFDVLKGADYDVVISDLNLPGSSGLNTCRTLLRQFPNISLILLSGQDDSDIAHELVKMGAQDFLVKNKINDYVLKKAIDFAIERKKLQEKILKSEQNLNHTKDKFFNIIAHDLRSPFNGLLGLTEIMDTEFDSYNDKEKKRIIGKIRETVGSTYKLVENLLEWARMQTGNIKPNPEMIVLNELVNEILKLIKASIDLKSISIENNISDDCWVFVDRNHLSFIIRNILTNAIKFTLRYGTIVLSSEILKSKMNNSNFLTCLSISDNGVGITVENLRKIFKIDQKISTRGTDNEQGTGLGLLLCKDFAELNGGSVLLKSNINEGTEVRIYLPANQA